MPASKRKRLAKYVYEDASGIAAVVYVRGHKPAELRFPLGTPLPEIRRAQAIKALQIEAAPPTQAAAGSVAAVISAYTAQLNPAQLHDRDERGRLQAWVTAAGAEAFATLTRGRLKRIIKGWIDAGLAPSTVAKRISSLRMVARSVEDDEKIDGPVHAIEMIKRPRTPRTGIIRARELELVERILANVTDHNQSAGTPSKAKARLALWAWTGQNPALLQQVQPDHVRWSARPHPELYVQPRRKGAGVDAGWIPLLPQAAAALREFFAREAGGTWNKGVLLRAFKSGLRRTQAQLRKERRHADAARLDGMLPRDLRHSIATALLKASPDVMGVKALLRHADVKTTMLYTEGAADDRSRAVIGALAGVLQARRPRLPKNPASGLPKTFTKKTGHSRHETRKAGTNRHNPARGATSVISST